MIVAAPLSYCRLSDAVWPQGMHAGLLMRIEQFLGRKRTNLQSCRRGRRLLWLGHVRLAGSSLSLANPHTPS